MKIRKKTATMLVILAFCMVMSVFVFAADSAYDSSSDPLIAKSYLDAKVSELTAENKALKSEINALKSEINELRGLITGTTEPYPTVLPSYETIVVKKGQTIYSKDGAVELIVTTGSVKVVSPFNSTWAKKGLSDTTEGIDVYDGEFAAPNHVLLIPKGGDGRGVTVLSTDAYVMIRGDYEIK